MVTAGDENDPLVIFLHGFPEFWYSWRHYLKPFVEAGYRVLAPDQRGYNYSETPKGIRSFRPSELSKDIVELIETEGRQSAHVIGHDIGASVTWDLALRHPLSVKRMGIINVPHPVVFRQTLRSSLQQLKKSWYVLFFQLPKIPEWYVKQNNYQVLINALQAGSLPSTFTEADLERYRTAWCRDGVLASMINWYRAQLWYGKEIIRGKVRNPTIIIWGKNDQALLPEMASKSAEYCENVRLKQFTDGTH